MQSNTYFLVQREGGYPAKYRHASYISAKTEAERLAMESPGVYHIYHVLATVENLGVRTTTLDGAFDGAVPF